MLKRLGSSDPRFKSVAFKAGLNIIVAEKADAAAATDTRNSAGKSSLVEVLHFCLGGKYDRNSLLADDGLRDKRYSLELDWPHLEDALVISRSPASASTVTLSADVGRRPPVAGPIEVSNVEWQRLIEQGLFDMPAEHPGISGRMLLSFLMRRVSSHAFNTPVKTYPQQTLAEGAANLAYLLGLDWQLAAGYRGLSLRESTRQKLAEAAKDPLWGRVVGRAADLLGQLTVVEKRVDELRAQIDAFVVVPEYEHLQSRADDLDAQLRKSRLDDAADRRNVRDIEADLSRDGNLVDADYVETAYAELEILLGDQVRRRYEDVVKFHHSVTQNRRRHLARELEETEARLARRRAERDALGSELTEVLAQLGDGGALDTLTSLQEEYGRELARLETLRNRYEAARALESSRAEIAAQRAQLQVEVTRDLEERAAIVRDAVLLFSRFAQALYGSKRPSYLEIGADSTALRITPHIESDTGRGVGNMAMFCFDLTVAVIARRRGVGPDFLVHDSHLFDGVEERQVGLALGLARRVADEEALQYIVTMNSDALDAAAPFSGGSLDRDVIAPRLTDAYDEGGLFGFRF